MTTRALKRPSYLAGTQNKSRSPSPRVPNLKPSRRTGLGNRRIVRPSSEAPEIRPRDVDFDKLAAADIEKSGIKVQLGQKTLEQLFKIQVPDPTDVEWIAEKNRRITSGESEADIKANPPFGRQQRTIAKMTNFGASGLNLDEKIKTLQQAVQSGFADNSTTQAQMIANIALILQNQSDLDRMRQGDTKTIVDSIKQMAIPKNWRDMGFPTRLVSFSQYRIPAQKGLINLFLLSNIPQGLTMNQPLLALTVETKTKPATVRAIELKNIERNLRKDVRSGIIQTPGKFLDLEKREIIPYSMAVELANRGIDGGQLNSVARPANGWDPKVIPEWDK